MRGGRLFVVATFASGIGSPCCHQSACEGGSCPEQSELEILKKSIVIADFVPSVVAIFYLDVFYYFI